MSEVMYINRYIIYCAICLKRGWLKCVRNCRKTPLELNESCTNCQWIGKKYIGYTKKTLEERRKEHEFEAQNSPKSHFHRALSCHGFINFNWTIIGEDNNEVEAIKKERDAVIKYQTIGRKIGYNMVLPDPTKPPLSERARLFK